MSQSVPLDRDICLISNDSRLQTDEGAFLFVEFLMIQTKHETLDRAKRFPARDTQKASSKGLHVVSFLALLAFFGAGCGHQRSGYRGTRVSEAPSSRDGPVLYMVPDPARRYIAIQEAEPHSGHTAVTLIDANTGTVVGGFSGDAGKSVFFNSWQGGTPRALISENTQSRLKVFSCVMSGSREIVIDIPLPCKIRAGPDFLPVTKYVYSMWFAANRTKLFCTVNLVSFDGRSRRPCIIVTDGHHWVPVIWRLNESILYLTDLSRSSSMILSLRESKRNDVMEYQHVLTEYPSTKQMKIGPPFLNVGDVLVTKSGRHVGCAVNSAVPNSIVSVCKLPEKRFLPIARLRGRVRNMWWSQDERRLVCVGEDKVWFVGQGGRTEAIAVERKWLLPRAVPVGYEPYRLAVVDTTQRGVWILDLKTTRAAQLWTVSKETPKDDRIRKGASVN